ncbi:MAG: TonB-dependent receptor [Bacteroidales bacterium]|nr:TonB-dependent receptor [Bacteroidales bacterium]
MKQKLIFSFLFFCCLSMFVAGQQQIKGKVTSADANESIAGATVLVKGTTNGTITDLDGNFSISVKPGDTLIISSIGYMKKSVGISNQTFIAVMLDEELAEIEQVVVIGYGTIKKSDLTGSVASVSAKDFNPGPVISVSNLLQNTAPGVVLLQSSAQPGGDYNIRVRGTTSILGTNDPLYVIDGMPVSGSNAEPATNNRYSTSPKKNPLNGINPEDIVSIEILKDASAAAIYGARGANGVVLITTKRGQEGKSTVNYNYSLSMQKNAKEYDMLNAKQFATEANKYSVFIGYDPLYTAAEVYNFGEGTNWMDQILRTGKIEDHQLSVSGGTEKLSYYVSGNYYSHEGIVKSTGLNRYAGRINLESKVSKKFHMGLNLTLSYQKDDQVHFGRTQGGGDEFSGLFDNTRTWAPTLDVRQPDGSFTLHPGNEQIPNPVSLLDIDDRIYTMRNLGTIYGEYEIIKDLKAKINLGFDRSAAKRGYYIPTTVYHGAQLNGEGGMSNNNATSLLGEFTLNYSKIFGLHNINLLGGYTYQQFDEDGFGTSVSDFASERTNIFDLSGAQVINPSSSYKEQSKILSYIGRAHYNYDDRYLLTLTARADGSTKFGENNKWAFFPSTAFAWKISNEDFYNLAAVNDLKLRIGYGLNGNQGIPNKQSQPLFGITDPFVLGVPAQIAVGLRPNRAGDPNLRWESTTQLNAGLDFGVLRNRIQMNLDYYYKKTTDVLLDLPLPSTAGFETQTTNAGAILNSGFECAITSNNLTGRITWTTTFNIAYNKNRWYDRAGYYVDEIEEEFGPVGGTYGYIIDGIWQLNDDIANSAQPDANPGTYRYRDVNGRDSLGNLTGKPDGDINGDDRVLLGYWQPDFTLGLNNVFTYGWFDLSIFFQGMLGQKKENYTRANLENALGIEEYHNKSTAILDRWTPTNPSTTVAAGILSSYGHSSLNSWYVEDASFIRLRNITLGCNIPSAKLGNQNLFTGLRIYVDAQNLFLLTKYKGLDPETSEDNQYPNAKTYTAGINLTF